MLTWVTGAHVVRAAHVVAGVQVVAGRTSLQERKFGRDISAAAQSSAGCKVVGGADVVTGSAGGHRQTPKGSERAGPRTSAITEIPPSAVRSEIRWLMVENPPSRSGAVAQFTRLSEVANTASFATTLQEFFEVICILILAARFLQSPKPEEIVRHSISFFFHRRVRADWRIAWADGSHTEKVNAKWQK